MQYHDGKFEEIERHLTTEDFTGETKLAAVRLSHDQQNLYISNRGHDSIAIFTVVDDGKGINPVEIVKSGENFQEILILLSQMNTLYVHIKKEITR